MTLLEAKTTGVQMSSILESASTLIINSIPTPFTSPQLKPITGLCISDMSIDLSGENTDIKWLRQHRENTVSDRSIAEKNHVFFLLIYI